MKIYFDSQKAILVDENSNRAKYLPVFVFSTNETVELKFVDSIGLLGTDDISFALNTDFLSSVLARTTAGTIATSTSTITFSVNTGTESFAEVIENHATLAGFAELKIFRTGATLPYKTISFPIILKNNLDDGTGDVALPDDYYLRLSQRTVTNIHPGGNLEGDVEIFPYETAEYTLVDDATIEIDLSTIEPETEKVICIRINDAGQFSLEFLNVNWIVPINENTLYSDGFNEFIFALQSDRILGYYIGGYSN
jgi:hypothetical protein